METPNIDAISKIQGILIGVGYDHVKADGDIGPITMSSLIDLGTSDRRKVIKDVQLVLNTVGHDLQIDGIMGPLTIAAIRQLDEAGDIENLKAAPIEKLRHHTGKASFFAGPQDLAAFKACKLRGNSDSYCFRTGDNGIGKWGADCASYGSNMAALPREVWRDAGKTGGDRLSVTYNGKTVEGVLGDTMPALANIRNGAVIDLNPGFALAFGINPMVMNNRMLNNVVWQWLG